MKVIKIDLPADLESMEVHFFADEHIGDNLCDLPRLKKRIEYVANTPNAYCILNGDLIDNAIKTSVGDVYSQQFSPMTQLEKAIELFSPLKGKVLVITSGNHEKRTLKQDGIDITLLIAKELCIADRYSPSSAVLFLRFGRDSQKDAKGNPRKIRYTWYIRHGSGGGRTESSKAAVLAKMASTIDVDIYVHAHSHFPMCFRKAFHRIDVVNSKVQKVDKLFVNTASNLNFGGYAEDAEYEPSSNESPVVYLWGTKKYFRGNV